MRATSSSLLIADQQHSIARTHWASARVSYTPYGYSGQRAYPQAESAFTGQVMEQITGHYLLGNGYRTYIPVLMRFSSPDSASPFGRGGVNAYAYTEADPINRSDPSGHSWAKRFRGGLSSLFRGRRRSSKIKGLDSQFPREAQLGAYQWRDAPLYEVHEDIVRNIIKNRIEQLQTLVHIPNTLAERSAFVAMSNNVKGKTVLIPDIGRALPERVHEVARNAKATREWTALSAIEGSYSARFFDPQFAKSFPDLHREIQSRTSRLHFSYPTSPGGYLRPDEKRLYLSYTASRAYRLRNNLDIR